MKPDNPCCLVIDSGYSFTHLIPYYRGKACIESVKRIDVGGKLLTNHLKEIVSYRQLNVMDETFVMNQVKEEASFVSQDFYEDMRIAKTKWPQNTILREYVLPDFTSIKKGYIREPSSAKSAPEEQILRLNNERFAVPEIIFHPSDVGISQMGLPEAIVHCISSTPSPMHSYLYNNILLTGGNVTIPGMRERLLTEVRKLAPDSFQVSIDLPNRPELIPWLGGKIAATAGCEHLQRVTQEEYREHGRNICMKRFHENQVLLYDS